MQRLFSKIWTDVKEIKEHITLYKNTLGRHYYVLERQEMNPQKREDNCREGCLTEIPSFSNHNG